MRMRGEIEGRKKNQFTPWGYTTKKYAEHCGNEVLHYNLGNMKTKAMPILFHREDLRDRHPEEAAYQSFLYRGVRSGRIMMIRKGYYALVDPSTGSIYANKFQIACQMQPGAYFSYHEALEYYGFANQSFVSSFVYLSPVYGKEVVFDEVGYLGKKSQSPSLIQDRMKEEGVRVVTLERAIVDSLDDISLGGGLEEVEGAISLAPKLDADSLESYLLERNKAFLFQKTGYVLEKFVGKELPDSFYSLCLSRKGSKINYLDCLKGKGKLNPKWGLIVEEEDLPDKFW